MKRAWRTLACLTLMLVSTPADAQTRCRHGAYWNGECKPAPPPPKPAVVQFTVAPEHASVFVVRADGTLARVGTASVPLSVDDDIVPALGAALPESREVDFVLRAAEHVEKRMRVKLGPSGKTFPDDVELIPFPTVELRITPDDPRASILVDGRPWARGQKRRLATGEHAVRVTLVSHAPVEETIVVTSAPTQTFEFALEEKPCHIEVRRGDFALVAIELDGSSAGQLDADKPSVLLECDRRRGSHELKLRVGDKTKPYALGVAPPADEQPRPVEPRWRHHPSPASRAALAALDREQLEVDCLSGIYSIPRAARASQPCQKVAYDIAYVSTKKDRWGRAIPFLARACDESDDSACLTLAHAERVTGVAGWEQRADDICADEDADPMLREVACDYLYTAEAIDPRVLSAKPRYGKARDSSTDMTFSILSGMSVFDESMPVYQEFGLEGFFSWDAIGGPYVLPTLHASLRMRGLATHDVVTGERDVILRAGWGGGLGLMLLPFGDFRLQLRAGVRGTFYFNDSRHGGGLDASIGTAVARGHHIEAGVIYETMPTRSASVDYFDDTFRLPDSEWVPLLFMRYRLSIIELAN